MHLHNSYKNEDGELIIQFKAFVMLWMRTHLAMTRLSNWTGGLTMLTAKNLPIRLVIINSLLKALIEETAFFSERINTEEVILSGSPRSIPNFANWPQIMCQTNFVCGPDPYILLIRQSTRSVIANGSCLRKSCECTSFWRHTHNKDKEEIAANHVPGPLLARPNLHSSSTVAEASVCSGGFQANAAE